jgi:hypothetical protein
MFGVLQGIRIVEVASVGPPPFAAMMFQTIRVSALFKRTGWGVLLLLASSCQSIPSNGLPAGAIVLPGIAVEEMLRQCSRKAPSPGERAWQPTAADIIALEAALPVELLRRSEAGHPDWRTFPNAWLRQYVGIVRQGRRYVYGSFLPAGHSRYRQRHEPSLVCDGGPVIFGAEYDVEGRRFTHVAFNRAF